MDSNGVSREGPSADAEEDDYMRIRTPGSESPDIQELQITRRRGLSEAQQLLPGSERNSFEQDSIGQNSFAAEVTQAFRYIGVKPEVVDTAIQIENEGVVNGYPQSLKSSRSFGKDVLMVIVTLPLFGLAGGIIYFEGKVFTEPFSNLLDNCIKLTATIVPIIFSMIVGRTMYKIASWKLERGSNVGLLEQLMGSRTFSSTVLTQFSLWTNPVLCVGLVLLWVLSPLGSQAALRMLYIKESPITSPTTISYISTRQPIYSGNGFGSWFPGFATLFSASLVAPLETKTGPMDPWNNVKIPIFSSMSNVPMIQDGWKSVPDGFTPQYSSLFGIPTSGIPLGKTIFTLESTYIELNCANKTTQRIRDAGNRTSSFADPNLISTTGPFTSANNITELTNWAIGYLGADVTSLLPTIPLQLPCLDCLPTSPSPDSTKYSGTLLYQDFTGTENVTSIYCTPSQVYIESRIFCTSSSPTHKNNCTVTAQRESLLPHAPPTITLLSFLPASLNLSRFLPNSTHPSVWLDQIQNYLALPLSNTFIQSSPFPYLDTPSRESHALTISSKDFGLRLGQLVNAFFYGSMWNSTQFLTGASFEEMNDWENPPNLIKTESLDLSKDIRDGKPAITTAASTLTSARVYAISIPWLTIYLLTTTIMLLAASTSLILTHRLKTPGYLGFVSTLVRESAHVVDEERFSVGVQAGGLERAKGMKDVVVRLGDCGDLERGFEVGTGVEVRVGRLGIGGEGVRRVTGEGGEVGRLFN